MSTGPQAPIVMVSGPIADEIGMNHGVCALGPGSISSVNVAIGRTLRLIMMNVGHSYPGISDMDTIGSSMKFSACVAENEDRTERTVFQGSADHIRYVAPMPGYLGLRPLVGRWVELRNIFEPATHLILDQLIGLARHAAPKFRPCSERSPRVPRDEADHIASGSHKSFAALRR